jgi:hypothetical protein
MTPELSFTVTGFPIISLRNPDGSLPSPCVVEPFSIFQTEVDVEGKFVWVRLWDV